MAGKESLASSHGLSIAANVPGDRFGAMLEAIAGIEEVRSLVISARLLGRISLWDVVQLAGKETDKDLIYDHKQAGLGGEGTAEDFAQLMQECQVPAAVLFSPGTLDRQTVWINALLRRDVAPVMAFEPRSSLFILRRGGYVPDSTIKGQMTNAIDRGVTDFWFRGADNSKRLAPWRIVAYQQLLHQKLGAGNYRMFVTNLKNEEGIDQARNELRDGWQAVIGAAVHDLETVPLMAERTRRLAGVMFSAGSRSSAETRNPRPSAAA